MTDHVVATQKELAENGRLLVELEGLELGVFDLDGEYRAYLNWCPHQNGPLCEGRISGTTEASFDRETLEYDLEWVDEDRVLRCPWHSWEFNLEDGRFGHDERITLPSYPVRVEDGDVVVSL